MNLLGTTLSKDTMPDLNEFMTTKEAAEALGFHVKSVQNMVKNQTLEGIKIGKTWLIYKKSISAYKAKTRDLSKNDPRRGQIAEQ